MPNDKEFELDDLESFSSMMSPLKTLRPPREPHPVRIPWEFG